jgi:chlorite dismutase
MTDEEKPILGHFATYRFNPRFWDLGPDERTGRALGWFERLASVADVAHLYLTQGIESASDVLVWSTAVIDDLDAPGRYFKERAAADNAGRDVMAVDHVLWGMTRPSEYSRAKSAQEIDSFADEERTPYLVMYPFTKTADWYLFGRDTRQGMMNEHIRIGKQYREITQLLLYSFGLQDQEFVVVYETDDLQLFSRLVYDLRDTEARRYTKADTPLHTAVRTSPDEWASGLTATSA